MAVDLEDQKAGGSLAIVVRNGCPSFVGQLNKFAVLSDQKTLAVLETVDDHAWLDSRAYVRYRRTGTALDILSVPPTSGSR